MTGGRCCLRRYAMVAAVALVALPAIVAGAPATGAQTLRVAGAATVIDPGRDCQVVRECNFTRGGIYRGCISAYMCRACRFVPTSCPERAPSCQRLRCTWR